jgi:nicotinamide-nucleotide amidase
MPVPRRYKSGMERTAPLSAEVIAIGDELVSGQRLDTNSRWLSAELGVLGIPVTFHTTAADTLEAGIAAFRIAAARADIVVATGGLGPTADDLTRDVLAAVAGVPLEESAAALETIESRFARRGVAMPASNRRQAAFPRGSRIIANPHGTAPGIDIDLVVDGRRSRVFALPGVPAELRPMWHETVGPALVALRPGGGTIVQRRIKCFGAGESAIEAMLPDLVRRGREPLVGITAHEATITLRIAAAGADEAACRAAIADTEATIRHCLGTLVYGVEDDELEDAAVQSLLAATTTLAVAEIGTEGRVVALLAAAQARRAAAPAFAGGIVHGPTGGHATAAALAEEARQRFDAACGLGVGAVRPGPEGRDVVEIVLVGAGGMRSSEHLLGGGPLLATARAAKSAVDLVRLEAAAVACRAEAR